MHTKAVPRTIDYRTIEGGELTLTSQTPLTQKKLPHKTRENYLGLNSHIRATQV